TPFAPWCVSAPASWPAGRRRWAGADRNYVTEKCVVADGGFGGSNAHCAIVTTSAHHRGAEVPTCPPVRTPSRLCRAPFCTPVSYRVAATSPLTRSPTVEDCTRGSGWSGAPTPRVVAATFPQ